MKSNGSLRGIITIKWEQSWDNYFLKEKRHVCSILWLMLSKKGMFSKSNWNIKSTFYKHIIAHSHQKWTSCNFTQGIFQNNNLQNQEMLVNRFINIYSWKSTVNKRLVGLGPSVYFHSRIDFPDEHVCGVKSDRSSQQPKGQHHQGRVAKIEQRWDELDNIQLGKNTFSV